jgi:hypothetical protein
MRLPGVIPFVCIAVGDFHGLADLYVERLYRMLRRHCAADFVLHCYTDRPRKVSPDIEQRVCSGWTELAPAGAGPTIRKLGLFNPDYVEFDRFIYLDISLIIRSGMDDLLTYAFECPQALVIIKHWVYDGYNSSVMCITRGRLKAVYDAYLAGATFEQDVPGDQDFIRGVVRSLELSSDVAFFPSHQIVSFKRTRKLGRRDADAARRRIAESTIVKFHGSPKMHEAFGLRFRLHNRIEELLHGNWRPVMPMSALERAWTG